MSAASLDPEIFHTLWAAPSVCPSVLLLGFSTLLLILLPSPFLMGRPLVPLWPATLQLLFPFFPLPPLPVPSLAQGADRDDRKQAPASSRKGEGVGARLEHQLLSTPLPKPCTCRAAWRLVTPPLARQGRMDLEERPDPRPRPGNAGLGDGVGGGGLGKLPPPAAGERQWLSVTRADPSPLVASFFSPPPPGLLCVCVCWGAVIPRGDLFVVQPQNLES